MLNFNEIIVSIYLYIVFSPFEKCYLSVVMFL